MDLFDDYKYTNGNFAAFGSSGVGKSTLLQCAAKRLREQGRKIICVATHRVSTEVRRCSRVSGSSATTSIRVCI